MSKEVQEFIEKLKDWKNNFPIQDYDYTKYDCEIADIMRSSIDNISKSAEYIDSIAKKIHNNKEFILQHPFYNNIKLRAIKNFSICPERDGEEFANLIYLIDDDNKFPTIIVQIHNFFDFIVTDKSIIKSKNAYDVDVWMIGCIYGKISKVPFAELKYNHNKTFFYFNQYRPYHYFEENLYVPLMLFNEQDNFQYVYTGKSFFVPKKFKAIANNDYILVRPTCIVSYKKYDVVSYVLQESLEDYHILTDKDQLKQEYDLTIWLGLPGERRAWLEQIEGTANMLKHFNKYFKKIKVYVDGMTAYDGERQDFPENKVLFNKVVDATRKLFLEECDKNIIFAFEDLQDLASSSIANEERFVVFKSLAGYDYRTKICYCRDCDITISDSGTTALVPFQFHKKPGVVFYGELASFYINFSKSLANNAYQRAVDEKLVVQANRKSFFVLDYHIPYQHVYNLAAEVLEELSRDNKLKVKNLKMHRLEVPPVELIAKQYELEKQFEVKIPLENVEFVDKLATQLQQKDQIIQTKNQELASKNQEITQTKNQLDSTKQQLDSKTKELSSLPIKKQTLEIKNLEQDLINKQLHTKKLEKELGYESNVLQELEIKKQELIQTKNQLDSTKKQLESKNKFLESNPNPSHLIQNTSCFKGKLAYLNTLTTAKDRIHNHLSYKLGQAMIENSKSLLGYIRMPYVLSYIKEQHNKEQKQYQEQIKKNPNLKLPNLESYPDYKEALKEKECLTYKLGESLIKANKTWYKGGYIKLWFEVRKLKGERK
ncbi:hypothetical protein ABCS21_004165 [Campylobacter coli]